MSSALPLNSLFSLTDPLGPPSPLAPGAFGGICSSEDGQGSGRPAHAGRPELTVADAPAGRITPIG
jgi:hypothetical protein